MSNLSRIVLIFCVFLLSGCGTLANIGNPLDSPSHGDQYLGDENLVFHVHKYPHSARDKVIFGGVMNDIALFTDKAFAPLWLFTVIDIPLSLGGDVVTLPFTIYWTASTRPPLTRLLELGRTGEVRKQLKSGVNVDERNEEGWTPLMVATRNQLDETVKMLLEHGANVNATTKDGKTPLIVAVSRDRTLSATRKIVRMLLERGANVNSVTDEGKTPLMLAALNEHFEVVRILLDHGANIRARDKDGETSLMHASYAPVISEQDLYPHIVNALLEHGARVNAKAKDGDTALIIASRNCEKDVVQALLKHGADVSVENNEGKTAVQLEKKDNRDQENCSEVNELLKEYGAE